MIARPWILLLRHRHEQREGMEYEKARWAADLDEGDAGVPELLEEGGLGRVGGRGVAG